MRFRRLIAGIMDFRNLTEDEAYSLMEMIMAGELDDIKIAAILTALAMKGETVDEITGFARAMRDKALKVRVPGSLEVVDSCGTGGDSFRSYNISTAAAIIAAAAGVRVAKHGNRAVTGSCGGADILEAAGVNIELDADAAARSLTEVGISFMFAPLFHRATARVAGVRRALGFKTVFNILGPLTSPAAAEIQLLGVFDPQLVGPVAEVLRNLGTRRAMVVHGFDANLNPALDEISTAGPTLVAFLEDDEIRIDRLMPTDFGVEAGRLEHLRAGSTPHENLEMFMDVLSGRDDTPAKKSRLDVALANAGALIYLAGLADALPEGTETARRTVKSGAALKLLKEFASYTWSEKSAVIS
ncbi:anthranilate phosphoribosyltransferase [Methanothermobacter thermautotrophicus]|jgi:anthranilate phosphoribosyltransferase|uniref:Anthranilate phosphoribosyltransferase n=1 Tax=Methanothermobacter thermautotrophicus TaxID=145262 RepID=A0A842YJV6_METTF|nr:anthranilate phosphoribosyltransferase [Methanothermobacter thermautotrophicus]MBE2899782.1 anthranilate phosphoribosyltransferase [Methanothermobacter thermautotrophicus]MCQ8905453.1 anthranilate phosphoribosyltransferase [Methanothermobacter sp.]